MVTTDLCLACFAPRGGYEVCPYCGFVAGTSTKPEYMLQPGTRLWGRYIIGTLLGIGGFGVTYRAYDTRLAATVAVKEFFPQNLASRMPGDSTLRVFTGENAEAYATQLARFLDEAKNMAQFTGDAHIVNVFDSFRDNGTAYIVMELLDGCTLKEHLAARGGRLTAAEAAHVMEGLLTALASIHKKGILHRDISPDNIFVLRDGRIKVLDFGAARFAAKEEWTQSVVVKKGYAPPEQYRSNMKQTPCTDLYAAGATWYKLLTGETPEESIERWEKDKLPRPSALQPGIEAGVDKAVMKAVALRPEIRFQNAEAMLAAVRGQTGFDFPEETLRKRKRAQRLTVAVAVLLVVCTLGVAAWQFTQTPVIISAGPTLADQAIAPDTITLAVYENSEEDMDSMTALAEAFMEEYPQHTVQLMPLTREEIDADTRDFTAPDAPVVYLPYWGNSRENGADLSLLHRGLAIEDYYFLKEYWQQEEKMTSLPLAFCAQTLVGSPSMAAAKGVTLPATVTGFEQVLDLEEALGEDMVSSFYGSLYMLEWYYPEIGDGKTVFSPEVARTPLTRAAKGLFQRSSYRGGECLWYENHQGVTGLYELQTRLGQDTIVIPLLRDGALNALVDGTLYVNKNATQNRQHVGMLLLHFALSEKGQTILCQQHDNGLPLNKKVMERSAQMFPLVEQLQPYLANISLRDNAIPSELKNTLNDIQYAASRADRPLDVDLFVQTFMDYKLPPTQ